MRILTAAAVLAMPATASAFCGHYVGDAGADLYNHTSQVAIARQDGHTTLTLANDLDGNAATFAMLIPVPVVLAETDVRTVEADLFDRLDGYSAPRLVEYSCDDFMWDDELDASTDNDGGGGGGAAEGGVTVENEFAVGEYQIVILSAEESSGLMTWLNAEGYAVSAAAEDLLQEYIDSGAYFFAAKVNLDAIPEDSTFLSPLQFEYDSEAFTLPIRIGTLSSRGEQDVIAYVVTEEEQGEVQIANYPEVELDDECMFDDSQYDSFGAYYVEAFAEAMGSEQAAWAVEYSWAPAWCDPCSGDPLEDADVQRMGFDGTANDAWFTRLHMRYTPEAATQDLVLYESGIQQTSQIRFIRYLAELEDRFPVCGVGMVDDPGSCDDIDPGVDENDNGIPDSEEDYNGNGIPDFQEEGGCGCSQTGGLTGAWLALIGLLAVRRRRS